MESDSEVELHDVYPEAWGPGLEMAKVDVLPFDGWDEKLFWGLRHVHICSSFF